jgi:hypothetical protein
MIASPNRQAIKWAVTILSLVGGALLTAAANEAWGVFGRVSTLEANDKSTHETLEDIRAEQHEMRQDIKELLRR